MNDQDQNEFERARDQAQPSLAREFVQMLKHNKKYWLIPLIAGLLVFGLILILGSTAVAPFIYTLF